MNGKGKEKVSLILTRHFVTLEMIVADQTVEEVQGP